MQEKALLNVHFAVLATLLLLSLSASAQYYSRYNSPLYITFEKEVYSPSVRFHPSIRPLLMSEVNTVTNTDSIIDAMKIKRNFNKKYKNWLWNKLNNEDLLILDKKDVYITVNLLFDFGAGYDAANSRATWQNTRGFLVEGTLAKQVSFSTGFLENQAQLVPYVDTFAVRNGVIPGQGAYKNYKTDAYDYSQAFGYVSYSPSSYFNLEVGYGKNFIGDGYRSVLLSDVPFNYPYFKLAANFWHIKYIALYAQFINREQPYNSSQGYPKKYGVFHYLDWAISKRVNIGLYDAVVWDAVDSNGYRGFDWSYISPVIFLRPAEFSVGSPDNSLLGLNMSVKVGRRSVFYGQFLLDEFKLDEVVSGDGWYANKYAWQLGFKSFDIFKLKNLSFQQEFNVARPFTYSHWTYANYAHYSQPLAHPLGANFWESLTFLKFHFKRWYFNNEFQYYQYGADTANMNYGGDIFKFYTTATNIYGNKLIQGLKTGVIRNEFVVSYLINPAVNMNISAGFVYRKEHTDLYTYNTSYIYLALRTSLFNWNLDF